MIIVWCAFTLIDGGNRTLIKVKYNVGFEETLICQYTSKVLVKPSAFIGLKREAAVFLDTTKVVKVKEINNQLGLF